MTIHLYLSLVPEALIASMLLPTDSATITPLVNTKSKGRGHVC